MTSTTKKAHAITPNVFTYGTNFFKRITKNDARIHHITLIVSPLVYTVHRSASQCGVVTKNGDIKKPKRLGGVHRRVYK